MANVCNPIYSRRKRFLPEYRQLFEVLMKIPDEDVRFRVTDAINGVSMCSVCRKKDMRDVGIQTEDIMEDSLKTVETELDDKQEDSPKQEITKKRRKRKRTCPKVVKTAQIASTVPVLKQNVKTTEREVPKKVVRTEPPDMSLDDLALEALGTLPSINTGNIQKQMKIEYDTCLQYTDGLLPIHTAITQNDFNKLRRQIYVLDFLKINLMNLLTEECHNVIQLAVMENCYKFIIEELLKHPTVHLRDLDDDCNTIIHLAITHLTSDDNRYVQKSTLESFELLLKKFDLEMLREKNNEGMTAIHLAVRSGNYLMMETMLKVIDQRLDIKSADLCQVPKPDKKAFIEHYSRQCENFDGRSQHKLKSEILNATDMKSGCTALYFAMEKKDDHMIYLLLAHLCDPTIKNLAGIDPKSYYSDYGSNAGIAGTLEKVVQALQKQDSS